jgi:hypothetical protein
MARRLDPMAETVAQERTEGAPPTQDGTASSDSTLWRFSTAIVLFVVFCALLALSWWLYPRRAEVHRPAPFALTMISERSPVAFDVIPLTIAPNPPYSNPSEVSVTIAPRTSDIYAVQVRWTYTPALCTAGQDLGQSLAAGCAPMNPPYEVAGSLLNLSLPHGATILHCRQCRAGSPVALPEQDSTVQPNYGIPDASVYAASPPAVPVTATWKFEIHDTAFAWAANGLTAEASLPIVTFQNNGNTGFGIVDVTYGIPEGASYDWNNGPDPDHLTWTEPVSSATTAVQVAGNNNSAASRDTLDVLIVGILLGTAGGALVGAIQDLARTGSDGTTGWLRRRKGHQ